MFGSLVSICTPNPINSLIGVEVVSPVEQERIWKACQLENLPSVDPPHRGLSRTKVAEDLRIPLMIIMISRGKGKEMFSRFQEPFRPKASLTRSSSSI